MPITKNFNTTERNSFRRAMAKRPSYAVAAAFALLAMTLAILAYSGPVSAQPATEVWSGTITAGEISSARIKGYSDGNAGHIAIGGLSTPKSFQFNGTDHTIHEIFLYEDTGTLSMNLEGSLTLAERESLAVYVGDRTTPFLVRESHIQEAPGNTIMSWIDPGLAWARGDTISFRIVDTGNSPGPTISGTPETGQTLTASTLGIRDHDGLTNPTYTYQWIRVDSDGASNASNPTNISGATSRTYRLRGAEHGKKVKFRVRFQDDADNQETRTSAAYPDIGPVLRPPSNAGGGRDPAVFHLITGINVAGSGGTTGYFMADISSTISNANFKIGNTSHTVQQIYTRSNGELVFKSNKGIPEGLDFSLWNRWGTWRMDVFDHRRGCRKQ